MRTSFVLMALAALAVAQESSSPVETTATDSSVETSATPTDTVITSSDGPISTGSQPVIPTGTQSTSVPGGSSGISSSASPSPSKSSSTSGKDSTSTATATATETETASSSGSGSDSEETNSDNGAFALPTSGPLLGAGLAGAALAAFI